MPCPGHDAVLQAAGLLTVVAPRGVLPRSGIVNDGFLVPAGVIGDALIGLFGRDAFWTALGPTLRGWALGLAVSMAAGIVVGMVTGRRSPVLSRQSPVASRRCIGRAVKGSAPWIHEVAGARSPRPAPMPPGSTPASARQTQKDGSIVRTVTSAAGETVVSVLSRGPSH
jgi:hypothetical protein